MIRCSRHCRSWLPCRHGVRWRGLKISVYGSGYVGLVTATCFAEMGNQVLCMDVDQQRIARLQEGIVPICEKDLDAMVAQALQQGTLRFSNDAQAAVAHGEFQFIAVGTPAREDGAADLGAVEQVACTIAEHMTTDRIIVIKSTVPVGTLDRVRAIVTGLLEQRRSTAAALFVANPEFLKEGHAVADCLKPDRIVIGTDSHEAAEAMQLLYQPFNRKNDRLLVMEPRSAELTKYAANAMLATKISFMNELAAIARRVGADVEHVRLGIGADPRIGFHFIYPGCGFGGSCLPKDLSALIHTARSADYHPDLLEAVAAVNANQKQLLFKKLLHHFHGDIQGARIALWGLAFKPGTNDMREAPSRALMEALWAHGAVVQAFDPLAMEETRRLYPHQERLVLAPNATAALQGADALVIATEWNLFRSPDFALMRQCLRRRLIIDGRNLYDPELVARHGLVYDAIGRSLRAPAAAS